MPGVAVRPAADFNLADSDAQIAYELTRTILRRVTGDMARWRETGCDPGFAAINLSSADLRAPGLVDEVATILGEQAIETGRSEEHASELQSLMRRSYAVFCLKKKKGHNRSCLG